MIVGSAHDGRLGGGDDAFLGRRVIVLGLIMTFAFAIFGVRLFQLQVVESADLRYRSERNSVRLVRLEAPRGEIVDRDGREIVGSRTAFDVAVIPNELRDRERTLRAVSALVGREVAEIETLVAARRGRERFQPLVLDADIDPEQRARVETHRFAMPGVVVDEHPRRDYLEGERAAHVLGQIGEIGAEQLRDPAFADYRSGDVVGQAGLEARLDRHLRGTPGGRNVVVDVQGREVERLDEVLPERGGRVVLTLDLDLQRAAEQAFRSDDPFEADRMGAVVAVDVRSGDVLAIASAPTYDPNAFAGGVDSATWKQLTTDRWRPLQNRAVAGQYAPGSTYKAIVAAAALQNGTLKAGRTEYCTGAYRLGRRTYRCWKREGHGEVDLARALEQSCDVFFYNVGVELGIDRLAEVARSFGLGRRTGIAIAGEAAGIVPDQAWKLRARGEAWIGGETVSASIGQGYNLVTPLQLALAYAAIANGGDLYEPRLIDRLETWDGRVVDQPARTLPTRVAVDPEHLARVREGLIRVVEAPRGTGFRARVPGMKVAGKTGTTQVVSMTVVEQYANDEDIPIQYRDHGWFATFAPADAPEIAVAVLAEHGRGGGSVAAPMAQKVLAAYYAKHLAPPPEAEGAAPAAAPKASAPARPAAPPAPQTQADARTPRASAG